MSRIHLATTVVEHRDGVAGGEGKGDVTEIDVRCGPASAGRVPRAARSIEAGMIDHVFNRGNGCVRLSQKADNPDAFERVLAERGPGASPGGTADLRPDPQSPAPGGCRSGAAGVAWCAARRSVRPPAGDGALGAGDCGATGVGPHAPWSGTAWPKMSRNQWRPVIRPP